MLPVDLVISSKQLLLLYAPNAIIMYVITGQISEADSFDITRKRDVCFRALGEYDHPDIRPHMATCKNKLRQVL